MEVFERLLFFWFQRVFADVFCGFMKADSMISCGFVDGLEVSFRFSVCFMFCVFIYLVLSWESFRKVPTREVSARRWL